MRNTFLEIIDLYAGCGKCTARHGAEGCDTVIYSNTLVGRVPCRITIRVNRCLGSASADVEATAINGGYDSRDCADTGCCRAAI